MRTHQRNKNDKDDAFVNKIIHQNNSELETFVEWLLFCQQTINQMDWINNMHAAYLGILEH